MSNCIFCAIAEGRLPSYEIYQDEHFKVIMDRYPCATGHVLIMPKRHVADIYELNAEEAAGLMPLAQKVAEKMREVFSMDGLNLLQNNGKAAGQVVDHFHLHLLPRYENDGIRFGGKPTDPPLEELERVAKMLKLQ